MDSFFYTLLDFLLRVAKKRFSPFVLVVCGSEGKTDIQEKIFEVLDTKYPLLVRKNSRNSSDGASLSLSLFDFFPGRNFSEWVSVLLEAGKIAFFGKNFPRFWVLELRIENAGDAKKFLTLFHPDLAIFTSMLPRYHHDEAFLTLLFKEFSILADSSFHVMGNQNDARIIKMLSNFKGKTQLLNLEEKECIQKITDHVEFMIQHFHRH